MTLNAEEQAAYDEASRRVTEFVGWYEGRSQVPAHLPPDDAPCPICWQRLVPGAPAKSVACAYPDGRRSMFYRLHPECSEDRESFARQAADMAALDYSEIQ